MKFKRIRILFLTSCFFLLMENGRCQSGGMPPQVQAPRDYRRDFISLYRAVQRQFYDSASGFFRDFEEPAPKNGYSYCWPLCGLLQAYNEAEAAGIEVGRRPGGRRVGAGAGRAADSSRLSVQQVTALLDQYKRDRKSTRLNSSHSQISYAVF